MDQRHKPEALKLPEENIGSALYNTDKGKDFLNRSLFAQELRATNDSWDFIKLEGFTSSQLISSKQVYEEEAHRIRKNFASCKSDRGLLSKLYNELKQQGVQGTPNVGVEGVKNINREVSKDKKETMTKDYLKNCSLSFINGCWDF